MGETPGWNMISPILRNLKRESVTVDAKIEKKQNTVHFVVHYM